MIDLHGQHAVVTGGNRGIGAAIADALAGAGAIVTITGRDRAKLDETGHAIAARHGHPITIVECDVSDEASVASAFEAIGRVDILVNNAGQAEGAKLSDTTLELWNRLLAVNLTGTFLCTRSVIDGMIARGSGRIINIASTAGLRGASRISAYCASKHGVVGFTRAIAAETARSGVTVNAVCPSYTETEMTERTLDAVATRRKTDRDGALDLIAKTIPIGRLIKPEEVAALVLYLCSPEAAAITGHAIAVDGGETQ